jgi:Holliday junction resolvase RusA-like endonuclease
MPATRALTIPEFRRVLAGGALPSDGPQATRLTFTVLGRARGLARAKATRVGTRGVRMYDPKSNEDAKLEVVRAFADAARGKPFAADAPVILTVIASYHTPRKKLWGTPKLTRPDADNICKLIADALDGGAYHDDAQIVEAHVYKRWAAESSFTVVIEWGAKE